MGAESRRQPRRTVPGMVEVTDTMTDEGGNRDPRDYDALLLQAVFAYEDGAPVSVRLVFHPISVSGETSYNNYQPVLLAGDDARRVLDKMADSTGVTPPAYEEGQGSETEAFPVGGA